MQQHPRHTPSSEPYAELVEVDPELASEWLARNDGNRTQKPHKIKIYARDMAAGDWMVTGDGPKFDTRGRLINGQHALEAVKASGASIPMFVFRNLDPDAQKVLDTGAKRSAADALKMEGVEGCRLTTLAATARIGLVWDEGMLRSSLQGDRIREVSNSEVLEWVYENPDAIGSVHTASMMTSLACPPSLLAFAHMLMSRIDADDAEGFFAALVNLRTRGVGDPIAALLKRWQRAGTQRRKLGYGEQLYLLFRTWNACRAGERLSLLKAGHSGASNTVIAIPEPK
jgi:hypothetical protein